MNRWELLSLSGLCCSVAIVAPDCYAEKQDANQAQQLIQDLGKQALDIIKEEGVSSQQVKAEFAQLLSKHADMRHMSRFILGKDASGNLYFDKLSSEGQQYFCAALINMLSGVYSSQFSAYKDAKFAVDRVVPKSRLVLVFSTIRVPGKQAVIVKWSVHSVNGESKIYDATVDGVSIRQMQKDVISGEISKLGFNKFLNDFKKKYSDDKTAASKNWMKAE